MEQILDFVRGVYTQHFSEICVMILGCIFVLMIMNLLAVKRCRRQVKETAKRTEGMIKMYFEQKKNIEQNCPPVSPAGVFYNCLFFRSSYFLSVSSNLSSSSSKVPTVRDGYGDSPGL